MEAVVLCGIQASGKTRFYADAFLHTHVRISRDLLRTAHRERRLLELCLETGQRFVVDKTNATVAHRRPYVAAARAAGFRVVSYLVDVSPSEAIARNARRGGRSRVPVRAILGTQKALVAPTAQEGFDALWRARPDGHGGWLVEPLGPGGGIAADAPGGEGAAEAPAPAVPGYVQITLDVAGHDRPVL